MARLHALAFLLAPVVCASASATPLQAALDAAVASGAPSYTLAPDATYYQNASALTISAARRFLIDGAGATLVFAPGAGVLFDMAADVEFRNVTVRYEPPCFSQGAVVAIDRGAATVDVRVDAGYAAPDAPFFDTVEIKLMFYGADGRRVPQSGACIVNVVGAVGAGVYRVKKTDSCTCDWPASSAGVRATISPRVHAPGYQIPDGVSYRTQEMIARHERGVPRKQRP